MRAILISLAVLLVCAGGVLAQGTAGDYERAGTLRQRFSGKVFRASVEPHWFEGDTKFWYRNDLADGKKEFVVVDVARGARTVVAEEVVPKDAKRPAAATQERGRRRSGASASSPDGRWEAFIKDHNVWLRERATKAEKQLSREGVEADAYSGRFLWSPDSKKLIAIRRTKGGDRRVTLVESSPKDQLQPKVITIPYLKPGDEIPQSKPHLFNVDSLGEIPVADALFANPWDVGQEQWDADSRRFTFLYNQRGHQVMRIIAIDADTGKAEAIINEECATFFDYAHKAYLQRLPETREMIWMSERSGWNHLYLLDAKTGAVKNAITSGEWLVRGVERVDVEKRQVWFRAMGIHPGQDPYHIHFARVNLDGTGLTLLTEGDGMHKIEYSPDGRHYIDTWSRADLPAVTELRRSSDGAKVCDLETADISLLLKAGYRMPERFIAKGRDGKTDIWGLIFRPSSFDPSRKYPVIENIYAGPQGHFVWKPFSPAHTEQSMAELGFVMVKIDGMGTNWRSKAFHDVCWKNLGDSGFPDRILWIKAAAAKYPQLDLSRGAGIYGGSAGGQSAMRGMTEYPDFYTVGAADCGCHDNRMDKIWWNELWMSWPVGPHYAEQSNVTNAHKLKGKLLLTVGELDQNVDPASTLQLANALIKANRDFDLLVIPGGGHGSGESAFGRKRRMDLFVRHLMGVEPPK